jgi:ElaB/YqjD/DUF883 family membrane-anchored ribosome-binding protein
MNLDADRGMEDSKMQSQRNGVVEAAEEVQGRVAETAQTIKDAAVDIGGRAQEVARAAGRQAGAAAQTAYDAAQTAYSTGNEGLGAVEGFARENVWGSLLIAAAVGYGLACLVKNTR